MATMKVFLTGITGFIGGELAKELLEMGYEVNALARNPKDLSWSHPNLRLFKGDVNDSASVDSAISGCVYAYHLASYAKPYENVPGTYRKVNIEGTRIVLQKALENYLQKVVVTSSVGVLGPCQNGKPITESQKRHTGFFNEYEASKAGAEEVCAEFVKKGLDVSIVLPSRVFGPGEATDSNAGTMLIRKYVDGTWRFIPGKGGSVGNYAYIRDVVQGHILAMQKGKNGERYILAGENLSFNDFFEEVRQSSGIDRLMIKMPTTMMFAAVFFIRAWSKMQGKQPKVDNNWVYRYFYDWGLSCEKARNELGYRPTPFRTALRETLDWLQNPDKASQGAGGVAA